MNDRGKTAVALRADRILLGRVRKVLLDEVPTERCIGRGRTSSRRVERRSEPVVTDAGGIVLVDEAAEERCGVRSDTTPRVSLLGAGDGLTPGGNHAFADAFVE